MAAQAEATPIDPAALVDTAVGAITGFVRTELEQLAADLDAENASLRTQLAAVQGELAALKDKRVAELAQLEQLTQGLQAQIDTDQGDPPTN